MKETIHNAKIESAFLGYEDHGIFTYFLQVHDGKSSQGFGGYALVEGSTRAHLVGIMRAVGVGQWSHLRGENIRIVREDGTIRKIGHIVEDKWFDPRTP